MLNQIRTETPMPYGPAASPSNLDEDAVIARALAILDNRMRRDGNPITSPEMTKNYLRLRVGALEHEVFGALWLDNRHRVLAREEVFRGTIDGASVHPREVVKEGLRHNAATVIFYHNHPSGVAEPSQADLRITQRLKEALALVDMTVLDHILVGEDCTSLAERGLL